MRKIMKNNDLLAALLVTVGCFILSTPVALAEELLDETFNHAAPQLTRATNNVQEDRVGRLLQRHQKRSKKKDEKSQGEENKDAEMSAATEHDARQLGTEDDEINTNLSFEFNSNPCVSVIAVDAYRKLSSNSTKYTESSFNFYPDSDTVVPFEFSSQSDNDEEFLCELPNGAAAPIKGTDEQNAELRQMLHSGTLISGISNIEVEMEIPIVAASAEEIPSSSSIDDVVVKLPSGGIKLIDNTEDVGTRRRLGRFEGNKRVLLVRVTDVDGRAVSEDAETISDKFFGTYGDTVTVKSGFADCSFGKMLLTYDYGTTKYDSKLSAPGVLDVDINIALTTSSQTAILQAAANAAQQKMQVGFPGPFAHVIFVLKDCYTSDEACNFAAYGYVNHWVLVTIGDNWKYPAVIMHELGHNLNFGHSGGLDGGSYTDHTCLMGNPLFSDDVGRMCFNPVKNYQIAKGGGGWYTDSTDIAFFNTGTSGSSSWRGKIIGVADYYNNPSNFPIMLKLETGGGSDYFISFNHARGVNSEVQQAQNQVTVYQVDSGDGMSYSKSMLKIALRSGRSATIENWRRTGKDLTIKVNTISTWSSPGYADVQVSFG